VPLGYAATTPGACRDCHHLRVIARLAPGATVARAQEEVTTLHRRLKAEFPRLIHATSMPVAPLHDYVVRDVRSVMLAVMGAVVFVLLIACVNVTNLLLAQGAQRRAEFAVRTALGAGRGRLLRQLLAESLCWPWPAARRASPWRGSACRHCCRSVRPGCP